MYFTVLIAMNSIWMKSLERLNSKSW